MSSPPLISVVIPAHNEEKYLPSCLEAVKRAAAALSDVNDVGPGDGSGGTPGGVESGGKGREKGAHARGAGSIRCYNCGASLPNGSRFCNKCGRSQDVIDV